MHRCSSHPAVCPFPIGGVAPLRRRMVMYRACARAYRRGPSGPAASYRGVWFPARAHCLRARVARFMGLPPPLWGPPAAGGCAAAFGGLRPPAFFPGVFSSSVGPQPFTFRGAGRPGQQRPSLPRSGPLRRPAPGNSSPCQVKGFPALCRLGLCRPPSAVGIDHRVPGAQRCPGASRSEQDKSRFSLRYPHY